MYRIYKETIEIPLSISLNPGYVVFVKYFGAVKSLLPQKEMNGESRHSCTCLRYCHSSWKSRGFRFKINLWAFIPPCITCLSLEEGLSSVFWNFVSAKCLHLLITNVQRVRSKLLNHGIILNKHRGHTICQLMCYAFNSHPSLLFFPFLFFNY